jgi:hypothetical protein
MPMQSQVSVPGYISNEPLYELNLFQSRNESGLSAVFNYVEGLTPILEEFNGRFLSDPLLVEERLIENSALPETVSPLKFDFITVTEYQNIEAFEAVTAHPEVVRLEELIDNFFLDRVKVLARSGREDFANFLPVFERASVPFGSVPFRPQPPAFFL